MSVSVFIVKMGKFVSISKKKKRGQFPNMLFFLTLYEISNSLIIKKNSTGKF